MRDGGSLRLLCRRSAGAAVSAVGAGAVGALRTLALRADEEPGCRKLQMTAAAGRLAVTVMFCWYSSHVWCLEFRIWNIY